MMNVSRFCGSTFFRKPNGRASIDCRTLSSVGAAFLPRAFSTSDLATSRPPPARPSELGLASANSWMTASCSSRRQAAELGDLDRDQLDLLRRELGHELRRLLFGQAHQQHRGFADVGHAVSEPGPGNRLRRGVSEQAGQLVESRITASGGSVPLLRQRSGFAAPRRWPRRSPAPSARHPDRGASASSVRRRRDTAAA